MKNIPTIRNKKYKRDHTSLRYERNEYKTTIMSKIKILAAFLVIVTSCSRIQTAEDVIIQYKNLMTGQSGIINIKSMVVKANYFYPNTGDDFNSVFYWKSPNLTRVEFYRGQKQVMAYNGVKAWTATVDLNTDTLLISNELSDSSTLAMNFIHNPGFESFIGGPPFDYLKMGITGVLLGKDTVNGKTAHHVKFTWPDGFEKEYFFDVDNGLLIFEKVKDQRGLTHTSSFNDYKELGGLYISCFRLNKGPLINDNRIEVHQRIVELKANVQLSDSIFIQPK